MVWLFLFAFFFFKKLARVHLHQRQTPSPVTKVMPRGMRLINKLENTLCFVPLGVYSLKYQLATLKVFLF